MKKNDIADVAIMDFTKEGDGIGHLAADPGEEGIGRSGGYTLFVKHAVIGDRVRAVITRPKKTYAYAAVQQILTPSPDRVPAACPYARRCGGCTLQEYAYDAQLRWKEQYVRNVLERIGGFTDPPVRPVLGMKEPYRYRNKAQYPVGLAAGPGGAPEPAAGFYAPRSHRLIPVGDCLLTDPENQKVNDAILRWMKRFRVAPYDEAAGKGLIRHILIRRNRSGQRLVCLIVNGDRIPHEEDLVRALTALRGVVSVSLNENRTRGNTILGPTVRPLYGDPWLRDTLGGLTFRISPRSFYQVNPAQTEVLYRKALEAAHLTGREIVYDLYCGIGTISLFLARNAKEVYGVEIVPDAIRDAKENAAANGIHNAFFFTGAAEELVARGSFAEGVPCPRPDVVVLDPPRRGCDPRLLDAVLSLLPERIVYVSCDPATLARDLRYLTDGGAGAYSLRSAQPVDLFGQTCHVETVCLLSNRKPDTKVRIDVDLEDYYRIKDSKKNQN